MNDADKKILDDGVEEVKRLVAEGKEDEAKRKLEELYFIAAHMDTRDPIEVTYG